MSRRCFIVVDMSPKREPGSRLWPVDEGTWPWRVIGDGKSIEGALVCAREYEHHDVCTHCGRSADKSEEHWRVYPIDRVAWELLTCGGPYEDALQPRGEYYWDFRRRCFVDVKDALCIRCKGEGELPNGEHCDGGCEGCGTIWRDQPDDREWLAPPDDAYVWPL